MSKKPPPERSDREKASREAGIYAYSRVASSVLVLLLPVIGARVYTKTELAFVIAVALLHEASMAIGSLGLADAVFYFIGRDPGGARLIVRQTSFLLLVSALPVTGAMMLAGWAMSSGELDLVPSLPWLALVLLIELPTQPAVNQMIASGHARIASGLFVGFVLLRTVSLLVPGIAGAGVEWVPIVMGLTGLTRLIAHVIIVRGVFPLQAGQGTGDWMVKRRMREILWFALPAGAALIAGKINPQIDKFAAKIFLGTDALAEYGVAAFELPLVTLVPYAVAAVMQARYVRFYMNNDLDGLRNLWFDTVRKTALLVVPLSMLTIAVGRDLVIVLAEPAYADAALPFRILTIVLLHRVAAYSSILQAINQPRAVLVGSVFMIVTNTILTWPLTLLFGYPGPAIASVVAVAPAWLYSLWRIGEAMGGGIRDALPWRDYTRLLVVAGAVALAVWLAMLEVDLRSGYRLAIGAVVYAALFIVAGRALRMISREDLKYLGEWLTLRMLRK
jgi:O-antigen/teichoic acid export membrane protein